MKIRTRTNPIQRAASAFWQALDDHPALPLAIVGVLLAVVGSHWLN